MAKTQESSERMSDPRIVQLLRDAHTPLERFQIAVAAHTLPPEVLDLVFANTNPAGVDDLNRLVPDGYTREQGARPYHHWLGKSRGQIEREVNGDHELADAIFGELESSKAALEPLAGYDTAYQMEHRQASGVLSPGAPLRDENGAIVPREKFELDHADAGTNVEPTFGEDQIPLSEFAGMSDDEILSKDGIGPSTLTKIRNALAVRGGAAPVAVGEVNTLGDVGELSGARGGPAAASNPARQV